jgi:hypothetical protein
MIFHGLDYLLNPETAKPSDNDKNSVEMLVSACFDVCSLSRHFSYMGRDIATPYLSCLNLEDPISDFRLLGNAVYLPVANRHTLWSFRDFFTGSEDLGFYELDTSPFGRSDRYFWEEYYLSRYVNIAYCVVDLVTQKRISEFFNSYWEAEMFAIKFYYGNRSVVKGLRVIPGAYFLTLNVIRFIIREVTHPIGFFSHVKKNDRTVYASSLFSLFRDILARGGDVVD